MCTGNVWAQASAQVLGVIISTYVPRRTQVKATADSWVDVRLSCWNEGSKNDAL
jgi:hypothetical protein